MATGATAAGQSPWSVFLSGGIVENNEKQIKNFLAPQHSGQKYRNRMPGIERSPETTFFPPEM